MTTAKVLVFGDDTRSFLATVRSLGRQGIAVHVAPANFRSVALRSRYIAKVHELPPWMAEGGEWLQAMDTLLRREQFDLVMPCDETALLPLQQYRAQLESLARLAIPDDHAITVLFDKHATRELARQVGVPVAHGRLAHPGDTAASVLAEFGAPVVVKPRRSHVLSRLASRGKVRVTSDPTALEHALAESAPEEILLEQFFPGQGMGVSLLASKGRVLQAFEHHRVRELSGSSFYRISAPLTPEMAAACEAIVSGVPYTGVAMFEFKRNQRGDWILLEVNARPWGSMPLPLALGVDFPYRWFKLLTVGEETPPVPYRAGIYGRNLLPDLLTLKSQAELQRLGPLTTAWFMTRRSAELLRVLTGHEFMDVLVRDDPRPGITELREVAAEFGERMRRKLPGATQRRRDQVQGTVRGAVAQGGGHKRVMFVCQGNICRSPFAEALLRARLGDSNSVVVESAGTLPRPARATPDFGQQAATQFGIDLSAHRSTWLSRALAEQASLLVVFDEINRASVFNRYPDLRTPVIRLDELTDGTEITDPVDGALADFQRCYQRIAAGLTALQPLLA